MKSMLAKIRLFFALPEARILWIALPALAVIFTIDVIYLPSIFPVLSGGFLSLAAVAMTGAVYRAAKVNQKTNVERTQLKAIILAMSDSLILYDDNFTVLFFNPAAEKLFGIGAGELIGKQLTPQDAEKPRLRRFAQVIFSSLAPTMVSRSAAGTYPQVVDISFDTPSAEFRTYTSPVADEKGKLFGFMKIVRDRTREVALIKSKSEFITVASHQLRTPITNLYWTMESLSKDTSLTAETQELLKNGFTSAKQLRETVEALLSISRIEEGRFGYQFEETDIIQFLGKIMEEALPQARRVGISLFFDPPKEQLPKLSIDPQKLSMAFVNLLDNAIRYNAQNGEVRVAVEKLADKPYVQVSVRDTGIGISQEDIDKLFQKFFRAGNAVKAQTEGSGLGLYISQNVVRAHGGTIWAESEIGRGTIFYFTLPTDPTLIPPKEVSMEY